MNEHASIESPETDPGNPAWDSSALARVPADDLDASVVPQAIEDTTDVPSLAFFPTMTRSTPKVGLGPVRIHPAIIAVAISLVIHVNLALAFYWVVHRLHAFRAARSQLAQGDGATALGAIDHNGNDQAAGAVGPGSIKPGWSAPPQPGNAIPTLDDPAALDVHDPSPPPVSAPPPALLDLNEEDPMPPSVAADVAVSRLQIDRLPVFTHSPPPLPGAQPAPTTAPVDRAVAATQPAAPVEVASTQPAIPTTAPPSSAVAAANQSIHNTALAMAAGFSTPASQDPGGLLHQAGPGGSGGKGGATTGDRGSAVTGRPGAHAGVKGHTVHADYPDYCLQHGESGRVDIEVDIRADGSVAAMRVVFDAGHPLLARAALDALQGAQFYPATLDGQPIRSTLKCPFVFKLR